jgi:ribonuclease VapC
MNKMVFDSSALLAFINNEIGIDIVRKMLPNALLSTVNFAEVITKLCERGYTAEYASALIEATDIELINYNAEHAYLTGELRNKTRHLGLSLGDRACLALAKLKGLPVLTADTAWAKLDGFKIVLIRELK